MGARRSPGGSTPRPRDKNALWPPECRNMGGNPMTMSFPKLTHDEAVREVYRLTPQIRDIDDFLSPVNVRWLPYTMFSQPKNYRSKTVNTDELGFRFTRV